MTFESFVFLKLTKSFLYFFSLWSQFSYVVDTVLFGMEALIQAAKKNIDYNGRISNHYIMRVTWCEEVQPCTASQMKTTLPVRSTRTFTSMVETGVGWPGTNDFFCSFKKSSRHRFQIFNQFSSFNSFF